MKDTISKNDAQSNLDIINKIQEDSKFIIEDDKTPSNGIYKVLNRYSVIFLVIVILNYLLEQILQSYQLYTNYAILIDSFMIFFHFLNTLYFIINTYKLEMSIKERRFLKSLFYYPIIVFLLNVLQYVISMYNMNLFIASFKQIISFIRLYSFIQVITLFSTILIIRKNNEHGR